MDSGETVWSKMTLPHGLRSPYPCKACNRCDSPQRPVSAQRGEGRSVGPGRRNESKSSNVHIRSRVYRSSSPPPEVVGLPASRPATTDAPASRRTAPRPALSSLLGMSEVRKPSTRGSPSLLWLRLRRRNRDQVPRKSEQRASSRPGPECRCYAGPVGDDADKQNFVTQKQSLRSCPRSSVEAEHWTAAAAGEDRSVHEKRWFTFELKHQRCSGNRLSHNRCAMYVVHPSIWVAYEREF